jgi:hypothetical protein
MLHVALTGHQHLGNTEQLPLLRPPLLPPLPVLLRHLLLLLLLRSLARPLNKLLVLCLVLKHTKQARCKQQQDIRTVQAAQSEVCVCEYGKRQQQQQHVH